METVRLFHDVEKYDDCLLLEGHLLENCITANLLAREKKIENARRAQDRIVTKAFRQFSDEDLAELLLGPDARVIHTEHSV